MSDVSSAICSTERVLTGTPRQVFAAFENAESLSTWWGPAGFTNTFETFEFKPEGRWVFVMHGPNGANYANESVFRQIEADRLVVVEHVVAPWFKLTVTLTPRGDDTHVSWVQEFESAEMADKVRAIVEPSNEENLDRWQAVISSKK